MEQYKRDFIAFLEGAGVLKFGDFTAKSGRKIPYFINAGEIKTGAQIARLGEFYAKAYMEKLGRKEAVLFGPAYKGIPLAVSAASALAKEGLDAPFFFNRKEAKDHGEGGLLVGYVPKPGQEVVIIEDVTTAGTSIRETVTLVKAQADADLIALVVCVDRQERGTGEKGALQEIGETFGLKTTAIVTMQEVIEYLEKTPVDGKLLIDDEIRQRIGRYYERYGVVSG